MSGLVWERNEGNGDLEEKLDRALAELADAREQLKEARFQIAHLNNKLREAK